MTLDSNSTHSYIFLQSINWTKFMLVGNSELKLSDKKDSVLTKEKRKGWQRFQCKMTICNEKIYIYIYLYIKQCWFPLSLLTTFCLLLWMYKIKINRNRVVEDSKQFLMTEKYGPVKSMALSERSVQSALVYWHSLLIPEWGFLHCISAFCSVFYHEMVYYSHGLN